MGDCEATTLAVGDLSFPTRDGEENGEEDEVEGLSILPDLDSVLDNACFPPRSTLRLGVSTTPLSDLRQCYAFII